MKWPVKDHCVATLLIANMQMFWGQNIVSEILNDIANIIGLRAFCIHVVELNSFGRFCYALRHSS